MLWNLLASYEASANASEALIEQELQRAFHYQVEQQGYLRPQNYEVKLSTLIRRDAKTQRSPDGILTAIDSRIHVTALPAYVHHEYAHACQIELGGPSNSVFMDEASATFQEILAFGEGGSWKKALADFQERVEIPPFVDVSELDGRLKSSSKFEYGGALFLLFLENTFGKGDGKWLRELWQSLPQRLDAMGNVAWILQIQELTKRTTEDLIVEFANWRLSYPYTKMMTVSTESDHDVFISPFEWPLPLGCVVLRIPSAPFEMRFSIHAQFEKSVGVAWRKVFDATHLFESGVLKVLSGESETTWNLHAGQSLLLSLCNLDKDAFLRRDWNVYPLKVAIKVK